MFCFLLFYVKSARMIKILFVCTGNICRSPTADGVLRHKVAALGLESLIEVDSAGVSTYHVGEDPDVRSQRTASLRGYDLSALRARHVTQKDFEVFDYLFAMDATHEAELLLRAPQQYAYKVKLFLPFAGNAAVRDVPDPYYGNAQGFEAVLDMIESGCGLLIEKLLDEMDGEDGCVSHGACGCAR